MTLPVPSGDYRVIRMLEAGETIVQDFEIPVEFGRLEGRVTRDGVLLESIQMMLVSTGTEIALQLETSQTDPGEYLLEQIPAGDWDVFIVLTNDYNLGIAIVRRPVMVYAGETSVLDIEIPSQSGSVYGTVNQDTALYLFVYEGHNLHRLSDPFIDLRLINEHEIVPDNLVGITVFVGEGSEQPRFEVNNLADGDYTLLTTTAESMLVNLINSSSAVYEFSIRNGEAVEVNVEFDTEAF